jgi:gliding motility-associated-like protein
VDLYKFDKFTGLVSRIGTLGPLNQKLAYGVEFSPNGNFLYASVLGTSVSGDNVIYQFDLRLQGLDEMLSKAYIFNTGDASPGALQLGIDQKIYVALLQKTHLGVIHQPNLPGQKCEYEHSAIDLGVRRSIWGLPTFPNYVMSGPIEIKADHICFGDTAFFRFFTEIPMDSVIWEFSDGTRSTELKPRHYYSEMGEYPILFRGFSGGKEYQQEFWVQVSEYPGLNLGSDREFCDLEPITLKSNSEYPVQWSTGSRDSFIIVDSAGIYWAVANNHGCELRDSVWLYKCNVLVMPNVFSPNGDGLNDVFLPIEMDALQNPHLQIFNRWGELLFETFDLSKGWDGTSNGNPVPGGTYFYVLSFEHPSQGVEYTEGMIELIR